MPLKKSQIVPMASAAKPTIQNEPVFLHQNGDAVRYVPLNIVTSRDAYAASLHILFQHVATFHLHVIELIAEKYNLDSDEIIQSIHEDKRFQELNNNPVIQSMGYFDRDGNCAHLAAGGGSGDGSVSDKAPAEVKVIAVDGTAAAAAAAPPPKKRITVRKKPTAPSQQNPPDDS
jgi:hypothetical protein